MKIPKLKIVHPLDHCESAKAYHDAWAKALRDHTVGSRYENVARERYQKHIGVIEDPDKNCEICMEELSGDRNKSMFQV